MEKNYFPIQLEYPPIFAKKIHKIKWKLTSGSLSKFLKSSMGAFFFGRFRGFKKNGGLFHIETNNIGIGGMPW